MGLSGREPQDARAPQENAAPRAPPAALGSAAVANYEVLGSEPDLQVVSSNIVYDAQRVTARAIQSGVVFTVLVVNRQYTVDRLVDFATLVDAAVSTWAQFWNMNAAEPGVLNIGISQEVDAAGELRDVANVLVGSSSERSTMLITVSPPNFLPTEFRPLAAAARASLDALEAKGPLVSEDGLTAAGVVVDIGGGGV